MNWQPIETVPKDGTPVLVYLASEHLHSRVQVGTFHPNITIIAANFGFDCPKVLYWMPIPPAPETKV